MFYISNSGLIEAGALSLLGASVKDADKIGKFGSGFKYAIATLIRHGVELEIYSGHHKFTIETRPEVFRDKTFDVIWIDGERTSITTDTGREWHIRDAIREIYSNAMDEGDPNFYESTSPDLSLTTTVVGIGDHPELREMIDNWEMYFCDMVQEIHKNSRGRILRQPTTNFFRRGVWICEDRETVGHFSYDFDEIDLPESRRISSHSTSYTHYALLSACKDVDVFEELLMKSSPEAAEWHAMNYWDMRSCRGGTALLAAFERHYDFIGLSKFQSRISVPQGKRVKWCEGNVYSVLSKVGAPDAAEAVNFDENYSIVPWPIGYRSRAEAAIAVLAEVGVDLRPFKLAYADYTGDNPPIAFALMKNKTCVLTHRAFEVNPDMLTKALVEEWTHLEHGVRDHTVEQQHVYLNLIVNLIKERKNG